MALVLCTGSDPLLMKTRQLILEQAGHTVLSASNGQEIENACLQNKFEVVVMGQSTPTVVKRQNLRLIRKFCPTARVLELYPSYVGRVLDEADCWLEMPPGSPQEFIDLVNLLASERGESQG
jgi:DNA-binding NarL/FixJ family response regulator